MSKNPDNVDSLCKYNIVICKFSFDYLCYFLPIEMLVRDIHTSNIQVELITQ